MKNLDPTLFAGWAGNWIAALLRGNDRLGTQGTQVEGDQALIANAPQPQWTQGEAAKCTQELEISDVRLLSKCSLAELGLWDSWC